ncbi:MAG: Phage tail protein (Tail_P2_I) [bacterium ADurb.Bin236]|nr:MAG: Phage tail protein (Tail_P2_I) [bacterium ADurb.Bin236]
MLTSLDRNNAVIVSWTNPPGAARTILVRKTRDYPRNIHDGIIVSDAAPMVESCTDAEPANGYFNYYRVFFQDADGAWMDVPVEDDRSRIRCEQSFDYNEKLYGNLPELYERNDENDELRRFLGIIAWELEKFRSQQSGLNDISNVNEVRDDLLEHLAWNVGWLLNRELPVLRQRAEIKRAVAIYRKKGTRRGLIDLIQGIMNWDMEVIKYNRNILMTGHPDSTTLKVSDPNVTMNMDTSSDTADYILGGDKSPDRIRIKIKATYDFHMFEKVRNKLFRILRFWVPACMSVILELATYNEESGSIADWRPAQADLLATNWLLTNAFTGSEWQILSERTTNNILWRTPRLHTSP